MNSVKLDRSGIVMGRGAKYVPCTCTDTLPTYHENVVAYDMRGKATPAWWDGDCFHDRFRGYGIVVDVVAWEPWNSDSRAHIKLMEEVAT